MSTNFEFFEGTMTENSATPRVTVRSGGQLVLTQAAVDKLGDGVTHVQLGYNAETKAVGIRPAPEEGKGRYLLRAQKNSASRLIDGKRFFAHQGVKLDKVRRYDVEEFGGGIIGFHMTEAAEPEATESDAASEPSAASEPDPASEPEASEPEASEAEDAKEGQEPAKRTAGWRRRRTAA